MAPRSLPPGKYLVVKIGDTFTTDGRLLLPSTPDNRHALYHGIRAFLSPALQMKATIVEVNDEIANSIIAVIAGNIVFRKDKIEELGLRLCGELEVARREGLSGEEIGAAIGFMIGQMIPDSASQAAVFDFARRHPRRKT